MVRAKWSIAERFIAPPEPLLDGRWRLARFTHRDAQALVELGIIPEGASTELLDGLVVLKDRAARGEDPTIIGKDHRKCVERLSALRRLFDSTSRHVECLQPLVCSETHVPEPDFMILRGTFDEYTGLPTAADAWCVVEVADASYERDAGEKLAGYARAGVRQYIILNLRTRSAETYTTPHLTAGTYPPPQVIPADADLPLRVGESEFFPIPMRDVLP